MIIIWGTHTEDKHHGVVADECPNCARLRAFAVRDVYTAPHVYHITVGRWTFSGCIKRCWACRTEYYTNRDSYDGFLREAEADGLSMQELARRTNSRLVDPLDSRPNQMGIQIRDVWTSSTVSGSAASDQSDDRAKRPRRPAAADPHSSHRVLAILAIVVGVILAPGLSGGAFLLQREVDKFAGGPAEMTAAELLERGPQGAEFVRITDLQVEPEFWLEGGEQGRDRVCWLVAVPSGDLFLDQPNNVRPARLILLRTRDQERARHVDEIAMAGELTGWAKRADPRPTGDALAFFQRRYPGFDLGRVWVVQEGGPTTQTEVWCVHAVAAAAAVVVVIASGYLCWLRRAARRRPQSPGTRLTTCS